MSVFFRTWVSRFLRMLVGLDLGWKGMTAKKEGNFRRVCRNVGRMSVRTGGGAVASSGRRAGFEMRSPPRDLHHRFVDRSDNSEEGKELDEGIGGIKLESANGEIDAARIKNRHSAFDAVANALAGNPFIPQPNYAE
jgi:hypothetical protein